MQLFLQSSFLQALAYSLIASVWQMALLWLAVIVLLKIFKLSSAQKFNVAFIAQFSGFVLFIYTCINAYKAGHGKIITGLNETNLITSLNSVVSIIMPYITVLYLGILLFKLVNLTIVFNKTLSFKKKNLKKIAAEQRIFVQQVSELFSIHRKVKIYLSEKIICPLTTGFFKPVILIPVAAINHLTTQQLEAVILHELAHIKRADYVLYILQSLVEKIFFFNIFSMMLGEIIERERENACDDWVLQFRYNSMHYAEALFKLGRLKAMPAMALPLQGKKDNLLLMRIKRLLHHKHRNAYDIRPVLLGLFSLILCAGLLTSAPRKMPKEFIGLNINSINHTRNNYTLNVEPAASDKDVAVKESKNSSKKLTGIETSKTLSVANATIKTGKEVAMEAYKAALKDRETAVQLNQENIYNVAEQSYNSLKPQYSQAVTKKVKLNEAMLQKALSYQNFKQLEAMLEASGDSIIVKENKATKNSYKKLLTIESFDKDGNKHVYSVVVELYQ